MKNRITVLACLAVLCAGALAAQGVVATPYVAAKEALSRAAATESYWTLDKMAAAQPMPLPGVVVSDASASVAVRQQEPSAPPGFAPGWRPGQGRRPPADLAFEYPLYGGELAGLAAAETPQHGSKPSNPRIGPYGPFQRWTVLEAITSYPKSTLGKLFFSLGGGNFVCSASVIQRNTLVTAGHCVSDGNGNFGSNFLFCPSYRAGVSPRGCWSWTRVVTSWQWHHRADPDFDYACIVTPTSGTTISNRIGNVTGWLGRAWNWPLGQQEQTFGYPQASPFNGNRLITTASPEWYSHDFRAGRQVSKIIGSDLTGGASGGPWVLGWQRQSTEFPDSDGSSVTDPGRGWVNGVNSHKRCRISCQSPPTNTNGVYWQEMTSPPFRRTSRGGESEDVFAACFANGGT